MQPAMKLQRTSQSTVSEVSSVSSVSTGSFISTTSTVEAKQTGFVFGSRKRQFSFDMEHSILDFCSLRTIGCIFWTNRGTNTMIKRYLKQKKTLFFNTSMFLPVHPIAEEKTSIELVVKHCTRLETIEIECIEEKLAKMYLMNEDDDKSVLPEPSEKKLDRFLTRVIENNRDSLKRIKNDSYCLTFEQMKNLIKCRKLEHLDLDKGDFTDAPTDELLHDLMSGDFAFDQLQELSIIIHCEDWSVCFLQTKWEKLHTLSIHTEMKIDWDVSRYYDFIRPSRFPELSCLHISLSNHLTTEKDTFPDRCAKLSNMILALSSHLTELHLDLLTPLMEFMRQDDKLNLSSFPIWTLPCLKEFKVFSSGEYVIKDLPRINAPNLETLSLRQLHWSVSPAIINTFIKSNKLVNLDLRFFDREGDELESEQTQVGFVLIEALHSDVWSQLKTMQLVLTNMKCSHLFSGLCKHPRIQLDFLTINSRQHCSSQDFHTLVETHPKLTTTKLCYCERKRVFDERADDQQSLESKELSKIHQCKLEELMLRFATDKHFFHGFSMLRDLELKERHIQISNLAVVLKACPQLHKLVLNAVGKFQIASFKHLNLKYLWLVNMNWLVSDHKTFGNLLECFPTLNELAVDDSWSVNDFLEIVKTRKINPMIESLQMVGETTDVSEEIDDDEFTTHTTTDFDDVVLTPKFKKLILALPNLEFLSLSTETSDECIGNLNQFTQQLFKQGKTRLGCVYSFDSFYYAFDQ